MAMDRRRRPPAPHDRLLALLKEHKTFRSAAQLHIELESRGQWVSLATVYRLLEAMTRTGEVHRITSTREARYRLCSLSTEHHYPLICMACDTVIEVDGAELADWAEVTASEQGFTDIHVNATITGACPLCHDSAREPNGEVFPSSPSRS